MMARTPKPRNLRNTLLMGVAVTALPLAGCELIAPDGAAAPPASVSVPQAEAAAFRRARDAGTVAAAEEFLRAYPDGALVRRLLNTADLALVQQISPAVVSQLNDATVQALPFRVRQALGVTGQPVGDDGGSAPSDGYSG